MLRLATIAALVALLAGCVEARFDPATSIADRLPDFSGSYDLAVGPDLADEMEAPQNGAIATLTREGNHYVMRVAARDGSGPEPKDELLHIAGTPDHLVLAYSSAGNSEQAGIYAARALPDGKLEVLTATTGIRDVPSDALQRTLAVHGYHGVKQAFSLELVGPPGLDTLGAVLWDPAVIAAFEPKVIFILTPEPD